jgi:H+/Cl- antiporter ClcA
MPSRREIPEDAPAVPDPRPPGSPERRLGDFTARPDLLRLAILASAIGAAVAVVALGLLDLIALISNLAYEGHWSTEFVPPDPYVLGPWSILVPVGGGLVIGLMARFGSERIRGHGIPEAMETILLRGSRMEPRLAVLKPLSSAISIGTGGPFGAEGPIIVTGGAIGSVAGQLLHLTGAERRSLLVAGAAGGMTAVFGTPVAAVLLAVELLAFELRPRSLVPAALSAGVAAVVRDALAGAGLIHPVPLFPVHLVAGVPRSAAAGAIVIGLACAVLAWVQTRAVYTAEDLFSRLPLGWWWWPAIGGVVVGVGGLIEPRVLGAGYATIGDELAGRLAVETLLMVLVAKLVVWSIALGSSTSGGILAPLLMMGAALGGVIGSVLPGADSATWALVGMAAGMAAAMRAPLTAIVFSLELTHAVGVLLPLLVACGVAFLGSVLGLRRDLLTERLARRGHHVSREYEVDPLQVLMVREAMSPTPVTVSAEALLSDVYAGMSEGSGRRRQRLYPVLGDDGRMVGVLPLSEVLAAGAGDGARPASAAARPAVVAFPDETLRAVAERMVASDHGVLPVVAREDRGRLLGIITTLDLLSAHRRLLVEESHRERPLALRPAYLWSGWRKGSLLRPSEANRR